MVERFLHDVEDAAAAGAAGGNDDIAAIVVVVIAVPCCGWCCCWCCCCWDDGGRRNNQQHTSDEDEEWGWCCGCGSCGCGNGNDNGGKRSYRKGGRKSPHGCGNDDEEERGGGRGSQAGGRRGDCPGGDRGRTGRYVPAKRVVRRSLGDAQFHRYSREPSPFRATIVSLFCLIRSGYSSNFYCCYFCWLVFNNNSFILKSIDPFLDNSARWAGSPRSMGIGGTFTRIE